MEPGEIVELQRGALKAKFKVFWMGAPGSPLQGQAGLRGLEQKSIWEIPPPVEADPVLNAGSARQAMSPGSIMPRAPGEKRGDARYSCSGGVSIHSACASFAMHGEAKDISQGGIYVETTSPLAAQSEVALSIRIKDIDLEAQGIVRASYPMVGMGISFSNLSPMYRERLEQLLKKLSQQAAGKEISQEQPAGVRSGTGAPAEPEKKPEHSVFRLDARTMAAACRKLAMDFDEWKGMQPEADVEQLGRAVRMLQRKFSLPSQANMSEYLAAAEPLGGIT